MNSSPNASEIFGNDLTRASESWDRNNVFLNPQTMVEEMSAQIAHKDAMIQDLNDKILENERVIIDLQENVGEKSEVISGKDMAIQVRHPLQWKKSDVKKSNSFPTPNTFPNFSPFPSSSFPPNLFLAMRALKITVIDISIDLQLQE